MVSRPTFKITLLLFLVLLAGTVASPASQTASADCEDELVEVREELNATKKQLTKVEKERDDYSQRLEDSTTILILVMFLLVGSYMIFYLNTRRTKIAFLEFQKRTGATPERPQARPRRRKRG